MQLRSYYLTADAASLSETRQAHMILAMLDRTIRAWVAFAVLSYFSGCASVEPVKVITEPRVGLEDRIDGLVENGKKSPVPPLNTTFTENEVNQILAVHMKEIMPNGLSDPRVTLVGNGALVARVVVDMDEYKRRRKGRGGLGPLTLMSGKLPVTARGTLQTQEGQGRFKLHGAEVNGIPFPAPLVREMITSLSRSRRNPEGYDIEKPFALPANIRNVIINPNEAVVAQ